MQRTLRRYENQLIVTGTGVAAFGIWSVIKLVMIILMSDNQIIEMLRSGKDDEPQIAVVALVVLAIVGAVVLGVHLLIGRAARAEGFGKRSGILYLVVAVIMILLYGSSIYYSITELKASSSFLDSIVSILVDMTTVATLIEMFAAAVYVKHLRKKLAEEEGIAHAD